MNTHQTRDPKKPLSDDRWMLPAFGALLTMFSAGAIVAVLVMGSLGASRGCEFTVYGNEPLVASYDHT